MATVPLNLDSANTENVGTTLTTTGNGIALEVDNPQGGEALKGASARSDGVHGASTNGNGVHGESDNVNGVFGESRADTTDRHVQVAGVFGSSANQPVPERGGEGTNAGVWGDSVIDFGVLGTSVEAPGVWGFSQTNHGTVGYSESRRGGIGVVGIAAGSGKGVLGQANDLGVQGISFNSIGVVGYGYRGSGVYGYTGMAGHGGVVAWDGGVTGAWAGYFQGDLGCSRLFVDSLIRLDHGAAIFGGYVDILGALVVSGLKLAVVPHPDGSYRGLFVFSGFAATLSRSSAPAV